MKLTDFFYSEIAMFMFEDEHKVDITIYHGELCGTENEIVDSYYGHTLVMPVLVEVFPREYVEIWNQHFIIWENAVKDGDILMQYYNSAYYEDLEFLNRIDEEIEQEEIEMLNEIVWWWEARRKGDI